MMALIFCLLLGISIKVNLSSEVTAASNRYVFLLKKLSLVTLRVVAGVLQICLGVLGGNFVPDGRVALV